jgi:hypothetical protein
VIGITNVGGSMRSHETRHQKNAEIYDQAYPIGFKKILKMDVREYVNTRKWLLDAKLSRGK